MIRALLKKQLLGTLSFFYLDKKGGQKRKPIFIIGVAILLLYAIGSMEFLLWELSKTLCSPLVAGGLDWVYFAFVSIFATGLACVGSVFMAKSSLFEAKDNDFLLSLPIPTWKILFARTVSLYLLNFAIYLFVFIPALVQYFIVVGFSVSACLCALFTLLFLPLAVLAISSLLGWAIAFLTSRMRAKYFITMFSFLAFMALYFIFIDKVNEYITLVIMNGEAVGETIRTKLYPFWKLGLALTGDFTSLLIVAGLSFLVFFPVYFLLSKTFLSVATTKRGAVKKKYRFKESKVSSVKFALFKREFSQTVKNPMVFLNAGIGTVLSIIACVGILFYAKDLGDLTAVLGDELAIIVTIILGFLATSNIYSASCVSLEGERLWILRSSPVKTKDIFLVKLLLHFLLTAVPGLIVGIEAFIILGTSFRLALCVCVLIICLSALCACLGLAVNLKMPNMHWTNEVMAVKQSVSAILTMFIGWGVAALVFVARLLLQDYIQPWAYITLCSFVYAIVTVALYIWLMKSGEKTFERL